MATTHTQAYPIRSLREQVTALEAAITLCLAEPKTKPVHRLRTTTRRIEGQMAMLEVLPKIPKHRKQADAARKLLKKLRRAAGKVRDIDVQLDLIAKVVQEASGEDADALKAAAAKLREKLDQDRDDHAEKLLKVLKKKQSEVTLALEDLLDALEAVEKLALTATELTKLTESWYRKNAPPETGKTKDDPEHLHTIRKVAKLARYIAENAPESAKTPRRLAEEFESLQQSGGEWHDWMVLAEIARENVGKSSSLTKVLAGRSRTALEAYRRHLGEFSE